MRNTVLILLCFLFIGNKIQGQTEIQMNTWRYHFSYTSANALTSSKSTLYAAAGNGIILYDLQDNSLSTFTKLNGLNDGDISAIAFIESEEILIVGYANGNIDLVDFEKNEVDNIDALKNSDGFDNKYIYEIQWIKNQAYLATGAGLVVLDLKAKQIKETYENLGEDGEHLLTTCLTFYSDSLFVGTNKGVIAAKLDAGINLKDYNNWVKFTNDGFPSQLVSSILAYQDKVVAGVPNIGIWEYLNSWTQDARFPVEQFYKLRDNDPKLLILGPEKLYELEGTEVQTISDPLFLDLKDVLQYNSTTWFADLENGLLQKQQGAEALPFLPNGPTTNDFTRLRYSSGKLAALSQGYDANGAALSNDNGSFSVFENGKWTNFGSSPKQDIQLPEFTGSNDFLIFQDKIWLATTTNGITLITEDNVETIDDNTSGSPLLPETPSNIGPQISSLYAHEGGMLMSNYGVTPSLYYLKENNWTSLRLNQSNEAYIWKTLVSANNEIWCLLHPELEGGILVTNFEGTKSRKLSISNNNGGLPSNTVLDIAEDRDGLIWVGTENGPVYFDPFPSVLDGGPINAITPIFEGRPLLQNQPISSITIDGGNRKWMSTTDGLRLFSASIEEELAYFNNDNSPLISNAIVDVALHKKTGELFILTDLGLNSFATDGSFSESISTVTVYPNPVRPGYKGNVSINGLAYNADVKITNAAGQLVFQGKANGGALAWNLISISGKRIPSGLYYVLVSDASGSDSIKGKLIVIN